MKQAPETKWINKEVLRQLPEVGSQTFKQRVELLMARAKEQQNSITAGDAESQVAMDMMDELHLMLRYLVAKS